jgi:hypothetical protein
MSSSVFGMHTLMKKGGSTDREIGYDIYDIAHDDDDDC